MLIDAVILVLREVLEAAVLVSVLIALSMHLRLRPSWLLWSVPLALLAIVVFASSLAAITDALDGAGQEVANAALQIAVYGLLVVIASRCFSSLPQKKRKQSAVYWLMMLAVCFAMVREGSEVWIYVSGFAAVEDYRTAVYLGSAIGASIGMSVGALLFAVLRAMPESYSVRTMLLALCLIGAGMVMQATMLLEQVDWLPAGKSVWDSSALVSEQSITGELLYAVFGYESSPSYLQLALYLASLGLMLAVILLARRNAGKRNV
ncbi:MAG: FTR1 family protein [Halioglobus sp.]